MPLRSYDVIMAGLVSVHLMEYPGFMIMIINSVLQREHLPKANLERTKHTPAHNQHETMLTAEDKMNLLACGYF